ncbi:hypothetical protein C8J57DRAFT_1222873 [Mycena rebaudengoi]|nr:hypothetical protein C8J57DRAFT_1222873 [Mycena rebaudengoi]
MTVFDDHDSLPWPTARKIEGCLGRGMQKTDGGIGVGKGPTTVGSIEMMVRRSTTNRGQDGRALSIKLNYSAGGETTCRVGTQAGNPMPSTGPKMRALDNYWIRRHTADEGCQDEGGKRWHEPSGVLFNDPESMAATLEAIAKSPVNHSPVDEMLTHLEAIIHLGPVGCSELDFPKLVFTKSHFFPRRRLYKEVAVGDAKKYFTGSKLVDIQHVRNREIDTSTGLRMHKKAVQLFFFYFKEMSADKVGDNIDCEKLYWPLEILLLPARSIHFRQL